MEVAGAHHHHHHHHHHQQELSSQTLESMLKVCTKAQEDKKPRPPPEEALKCPRCDSGNTKFCYYNNYSLTQPRYFCKSCRRYWTKGGTLRNVPVGGGCRKNKRPSSSAATSSTTSLSRGPQDHLIQQHPLNFITPNCASNPLLAGLPHLPYDSTCTDLSLAFARLQSQANGPVMGYDHFDHTAHHLGPVSNVDQLGFHHNLFYNNEGNLGNGELMGMSTMFHDHQEQEQEVKQEACNMVRPSTEVGLWGVPWQMGAGAGGGPDLGTMVHEVEPGRSLIGGWNNGIGSTNWHGLINSPLM